MAKIMLGMRLTHILNSCIRFHARLDVQKNISESLLVVLAKNLHTHEFLQCRSKDSELFVSGIRAQEVHEVVSPHLDISKTLQNDFALKCNVRLRKMNIDIEYLLQMWEELQQLKSLQNELEGERTIIASSIKSLVIQKDESKREEIEEWKLRGKEARKKLKDIKTRIWDLEDTVVLDFLKLPNNLDYLDEVDKVLVSLYDKPKFEYEAKGHKTLGEQNNELEFIDNSPTAYYLKNQLAVLELSCGEYFCNVLRNHGYLHQSNPDFANGVIVEGSGIHISEIENFFMLNNCNSDKQNFHSSFLVGGASLQSFSAYFAKHIVDNPECLPQKLVTFGRSYSPSSNENFGLLNCWQSTVVDGFIVFQNVPATQEQLVNETFMALVHSYTQLKIHFEVKKYAPNNLMPHESAAIGIVVFSPVTQAYHEVGRISVCGNYISKRLLMLHKASDKNASFLSVIYVRMCNITRLLALIMENRQREDGSYDIPDVLRELMYV